LPELINYATKFYGKSEHARVKFYSSGLFTAFLGIGQILGPMYGTIVTQLLNFRSAQDIFAIAAAIYVIVYYFVADGHEAFQSTFFGEEIDADKK